MLNRTLAFALALAVTAAPISVALADGGDAGTAAAGGVGDAGPNATASPRSKVGADATRGHVAAGGTLSANTAKNATALSDGSHGTAGSGNTGSANVSKPGSATTR